MNMSIIIELTGYLGSLLVVVSMLMSSIVKLRIINTAGCCISAVYALVIHSYPLAFMNLCLIMINVYNLAKLLKTEQHYNLVCVKTDDSLLNYFLNFYKNDIQNFFTEVNMDNILAETAYIVCCDTALAGVLLGKKKEDGSFDILIDYTTPAYRDCSVGKFLYSKLSENKIRKLTYFGRSERHKPYLQKMGFINENGAYVKHLI
ncbi:MAG: hypothetical protein K2N61_10550 [Lachnospiraceae bacterium]|nr:hypothetical protein [Lachnospiraceae bacterium]